MLDRKRGSKVNVPPERRWTGWINTKMLTIKKKKKMKVPSLSPE